MSPEWVLQVVMPRKTSEGKIEGQPIIEIQTDREIEDTHIGIGEERFEIRKKTEKPMMCKKCLQFGHPKKYCTRNESYCNICAVQIDEGEDEKSHTCRGDYCLYCEQGHRTGDKQKCDEYRKEATIKNKMTEQKCDIFEARKILGISRGKSYAAIMREKKQRNSRTTQSREEETNTTRREPEENATTITRTQTGKITFMDSSPPPFERN